MAALLDASLDTRMSREESQELTRLSAQMAASETALLRQWIREVCVLRKLSWPFGVTCSAR